MWTETSTKGSGARTVRTETANTRTLMVPAILVAGSRTSNKGSGSKAGQMEPSTRAIIKKGKNMALVNSSGKMDRTMMGNSIIIISTERVSISGLMAGSMWALGKTIKWTAVN